MKRNEQKFRILAVERILKVGQFVTTKQILEELDLKYGIIADRKTIYDDIDTINKIVPVEIARKKNGGYRLANVLVESEQVPFDRDGYICQYNEECRCLVYECEKCGWNPAVTQRRLQKMKGM